MSKREDVYSRIRKIVGDRLQDKNIHIVNLPFFSKTAELLALCGVLGFDHSGEFKVEGITSKAWGVEESASQELIMRQICDHIGFEDRWRTGRTSKPSIIIGGGDKESFRQVYDKTVQEGVPGIAGLLLKGGTSMLATFFPDSPYPYEESEMACEQPDQKRYFDWIDLNNQAANLAKALLLEKTDRARQDITDMLRSGKTLLLGAHPSWPWVSRYLNPINKAEMNFFRSAIDAKNEQTYSLNGHTVMIVGLGSLGSIAADHFRVLGGHVVGIDPKNISIYNSIRQLYPTRCIGKPKAEGLPEILAIRQKEDFVDFIEDGAYHYVSQSGQMFAGLQAEIEDNRKGKKLFRELVDRFSPDLIIFATAHPAEFRMAHVAREIGIPHIVARCYRRARWFELTAVDGRDGPCFGCLQGHLYTGRYSSPTEEQSAFYDTGEGSPTVEMIDAEPATRVETGRSADVLARLACELVLPKEKRSGWFRRMMNEDRNCLIGGNHAEYKKGEWSYGIASPGGTALYGVVNFAGSETEEEVKCLYCGNIHEVLIHRRNFSGE